MVNDSLPSRYADPLPVTATTALVLLELPEIRAEHHGIEKLWIARYELLERHGYRLRQRFRPGWIPAPRGEEP